MAAFPGPGPPPLFEETRLQNSAPSVDSADVLPVELGAERILRLDRSLDDVSPRVPGNDDREHRELGRRGHLEPRPDVNLTSRPRTELTLPLGLLLLFRGATQFSDDGPPKEPDPGPARSLQSGRSHAGHPG